MAWGPKGKGLLVCLLVGLVCFGWVYVCFDSVWTFWFCFVLFRFVLLCFVCFRFALVCFVWFWVCFRFV